MIQLMLHNYSLKEIGELIRILETAKNESIVGDCEEETYDTNNQVCKYCLYKYLCDDMNKTIDFAKTKQTEMLVSKAKKIEKNLSRVRKKY